MATPKKILGIATKGCKAGDIVTVDMPQTSGVADVKLKPEVFTADWEWTDTGTNTGTYYTSTVAYDWKTYSWPITFTLSHQRRNAEAMRRKYEPPGVIMPTVEEIKKFLMMHYGKEFDDESLHPRMKGATQMNGPNPQPMSGVCATPYREEIVYCFEVLVADTVNKKVLHKGHVFAKTPDLAIAEVDLKKLATEAGVKIDDLRWRVWDILNFQEAQKVRIAED